MLSVDDWISLRERYGTLKDSYDIPEEYEMKWELLWLAKSNRAKFTEKHPDIAHLSFGELLQFVRASIKDVMACNSCRVIYTVTANCASCDFSERTVWKMHLENIMQRVEMQIDNRKSNLAILFLDSDSQKKERFLRECYSELVRDGVFLNYRHLKDSISVEYSHHSFAMQVADFCVGVFNGMLKGYEDSISVFKLIFPRIVKHSTSQKFMGYGICDVPTDKTGTRKYIEKLVVSAIQQDK